MDYLETTEELLRKFKDYLHSDFVEGINYEEESNMLYYKKHNSEFIVEMYYNVKNKPEELVKFINLISETFERNTNSDKYTRLFFDASETQDFEVFNFICEQNPQYFKEAEINIDKDMMEKYLKYNIISYISLQFPSYNSIFTNYFYNLVPIYYEHLERENNFYIILNHHINSKTINKIPELIKIFKQKKPGNMDFTYTMYEYDYTVNILSHVLIDSKPDDKNCIEYIYHEFEEIILSNIRNNLLYLNNLIKETYDNSYYFLEDEDPFYEININIINLLNTLPIELIDVKSLVSSLVLCNNVTVSNHLTNFPKF